MNITLIGMPGCGKSTVGLALARACSMRFVDVDKVIMEKTGKTLAQIIEESGDQGFRDVENRINAELDVRNSVIAPGGSVVYGTEAMEHLRKISRVIYLKVPQDELERRLGDLHERGVSIRPGQTFTDLYQERCPLYERYAHMTIDAARLDDVVTELRQLVRREKGGK